LRLIPWFVSEFCAGFHKMAFFILGFVAYLFLWGAVGHPGKVLSL
jgi:hypothetical protein